MSDALPVLRPVLRTCVALGTLYVLSQPAFVHAMGPKPMTTVATLDDQTISRALMGTDWRREQARVSEGIVPGSGSSARCRFYTAHNTVVPGAGVVNFVVDHDGALRARTDDMESLAFVLRNCLPPEADAAIWADVIAGFSSVRPPGVILPDDKLSQGSLPAGRYQPPTRRMVGGDTWVEFLATTHDLRNIQVKAVLPATGPVRIEMQPV